MKVSTVKWDVELFRHMCEEDPTLLDECEDEIYEAAFIMLQAEENYIDKMFEMGDIEGMKAYDLKHFIRNRLNDKIHELGYPRHSYFETHLEAAKNLDWFDHLTGGVTHTDFFSVRPTDYSKANEGEDFNDMW